MNKVDLAKRLARVSHRSRGKAADAVDTLVHKLLKGLRQAPQDEVVINYNPVPAGPSKGKKARS